MLSIIISPLALPVNATYMPYIDTVAFNEDHYIFQLIANKIVEFILCFFG